MAEKTGAVVRIAAFDPAITNMGWAVLDYDTVTQKLTVVATGEMNGVKMSRYLKEMRAVFNKQFCALVAYEKFIKKEIFQKYKPDYVVSESPFYYKFVNTMASLVLVINVIRRCSYEIFFKDIYTVAPMETKKEVCNNNMAKKDEIRTGILSNENIVFNADIKKDELSEHEYDAIGHGLCLCRRILPTLLAS